MKNFSEVNPRNRVDWYYFPPLYIHKEQFFNTASSMIFSDLTGQQDCTVLGCWEGKCDNGERYSAVQPWHWDMHEGTDAFRSVSWMPLELQGWCPVSESTLSVSHSCVLCTLFGMQSTFSLNLCEPCLVPHISHFSFTQIMWHYTRLWWL